MYIPAELLMALAYKAALTDAAYINFSVTVKGYLKA